MQRRSRFEVHDSIFGDGSYVGLQDARNPAAFGQLELIVAIRVELLCLGAHLIRVGFVGGGEPGVQLPVEFKFVAFGQRADDGVRKDIAVTV